MPTLRTTLSTTRRKYKPLPVVRLRSDRDLLVWASHINDVELMRVVDLRQQINKRVATQVRRLLATHDSGSPLGRTHAEKERTYQLIRLLCEAARQAVVRHKPQRERVSVNRIVSQMLRLYSRPCRITSGPLEGLAIISPIKELLDLRGDMPLRIPHAGRKPARADKSPSQVLNEVLHSAVEEVLVRKGVRGKKQAAIEIAHQTLERIGIEISERQVWRAIKRSEVPPVTIDSSTRIARRLRVSRAPTHPNAWVEIYTKLP